MTSLLRSRRYSATTKSAHGGFVNTTIRTCDGCLNEMAIDVSSFSIQYYVLYWLCSGRGFTIQSLFNYCYNYTIQKKCSGKQLWQLFVNTCDIDEQDFFGLQYVRLKTHHVLCMSTRSSVIYSWYISESFLVFTWPCVSKGTRHTRERSLSCGHLVDHTLWTNLVDIGLAMRTAANLKLVK